jgi:hypothetical protein
MAAVNTPARVAGSVAAVLAVTLLAVTLLAAGLLAGCSAKGPAHGPGLYDQFNKELSDRRSAVLDACTQAPNGPCSDAMEKLMITVGNVKSAVDAEHDQKKYAETLRILEVADRDFHKFRDAQGCEGVLDTAKFNCPSYASVVVTDIDGLLSALLRA